VDADLPERLRVRQHPHGFSFRQSNRMYPRDGKRAARIDAAQIRTEPDSSRVKILYALHPPDPEYLEGILSKMKGLGPPALHAYWRRNSGSRARGEWRAFHRFESNCWYALEGSHRIAAAKKLKLIPLMKQVFLTSEIDHDTDDVWPDRRVSSLLEFYDEKNWWVRYEF
jgi:hypothetical protein